MTETYLVEYLRKNGQVSLNSEINKIYQSNGLWKIEFIQNKKKKYITCNNVFLCCGSIDNIKILKNNNL